MIVSTSRAGVADAVTELVLARPGRTRLVLDGPPPADPGSLAAEIGERLRVAGRVAVPVRAADFLRPASVRLEYGRADPDEFLDGWLDEGALRREVLDPAGRGGSGRVLPRLWNADTDRAYRAGYEQLPDDGVVVLSGALLLGRGLPADLAVHLRMGERALARLLPPDEHWTLPAYARYASTDPGGRGRPGGPVGPPDTPGPAHLRRTCPTPDAPGSCSPTGWQTARERPTRTGATARRPQPGVRGGAPPGGVWGLHPQMSEAPVRSPWQGPPERGARGELNPHVLSDTRT